MEEFLPAAEVALELDADALSGERRLGEVAVVGLVVGFQRERTARRESVLDVEVADEVVAVHLVLVLAIAEVAVELQSATQHLAAHECLCIQFLPAFFASSEVRAKRPACSTKGLRHDLVEA